MHYSYGAALRGGFLKLCAAVLLGPCVINPAMSADQHRPVVQAWVTSADQSRLLLREPDVSFQSGTEASHSIVVDAHIRYQQMVGFGAALTDASAWLIQTRMNPEQREALLQDLFGRSGGVGLSFTRLTIGASDFSRSHYSFDDMPAGQSDLALAHFSIAPNRADVMPVIKRALTINPSLRVMASPWSAPGWMKTTDSLIAGTLRPDAYGVFADYLLRYLDAYSAEGVPIFALTLQNEPHFEPGDYPGMRLDPAARAALIGKYLGPKLAKRGSATRILDWDHNWDLPEQPLAVLADPVARQYVAGVAWHCYGGAAPAQSVVHDAYPDKETYFTECSGGDWSPHALLSATRDVIIGSVRGWAKGVLLWNLALDENRGPHTGGCTDCSGVVTINSVSGAVTRNPEYYALAHLSRFVHPGAYRIASSVSNSVQYLPPVSAQIFPLYRLVQNDFYYA